MTFDTIIIGGSYAGLSAAMTLGRSLRKVLIIDSGEPCNRQTPRAHNFITHDGQSPDQIRSLAKEQVLQYDTVTFQADKAIKAQKLGNGFEVRTESGNTYTGRTVLLATGVSDQMRPIPGFAECWGTSIIHCPYCHGYEVRNSPIGILSNSGVTYDFVRLLSNWSKDLHVFTDGPCELPDDACTKLKKHGIPVIEDEIQEFRHEAGQLKSIVFKNGLTTDFPTLFVRTPFSFATDLHEQLGCQLTEDGYLQVDAFQRTTVPGVFAAGDAAHAFRAVSVATGSGTTAGAYIHHDLMHEEEPLA
ncbi:NAD(P)/FAD-dependent oxidoreductase [Siphonobacter sp.]|uniref:NAD(P)/FAD-dependent oxidoreductase n=1 Tax=Siphonobacter sp. TaxID=1869184 RepID=UPI003B3AC3E5